MELISFVMLTILLGFSSIYSRQSEGIGKLSSSEVHVQDLKRFKVYIPTHPLAQGCLCIESRRDIPYASFDKGDYIEMYTLLRTIATVWKKQGISDYMIYTKQSEGTSPVQAWEIVPFKREGSPLWKQFRVLWNIVFGAFRSTQVEQEECKKNFESCLGNKHIGDNSRHTLQKRVSSMQTHVKGASSAIQDAFCDSAVIEKQLIFEGKTINVLYNYAPLAQGDHFLVVPKTHRASFTDLSQEEYVEANTCIQKLVSLYHSKGNHTAYIFDKTGSFAGQTVPHWHVHVVLTATKTQAIYGKIQVLKNMLLGSSPLRPEELKRRVEVYRKELNPALSASQ